MDRSRAIHKKRSILEVFLQTTEDLKIDHYLELDDKQKKYINNLKLAYKMAKELYEKTKQRSPELEEIIMKDPEYAYYYASIVIKDRWPEAEPYVMKDPGYATYYAENVIKKRWIEAEPYIKKNRSWWDRYKQQFIL